MPSPMTHHTTCTHNAVTRQPVTESVLIWRHHLTQTYDITLFYSTMCLRGLISPIIHRVYIFGTFGRYFGSIINALTSRRNDFAYAIVWRTPEIGRNLSRSLLILMLMECRSAHFCGFERWLSHIEMILGGKVFNCSDYTLDGYKFDS